AYLLKANHWVNQKIVMSHVYGHSDFFKNNMWFKTTDRKMMDTMANHGTKVRRYMEKYGQDTVEKFIDAVHSLENLLDLNRLFVDPDARRTPTSEDQAGEFSDERSQALKTYMRKQEHSGSREKRPEESLLNRITHQLPERDVMKFLMEHAPITEWQADVVGILRDEAYYYLPQRVTKIMNEGW